MMSWIKRIKAALGVGLTWAVVWGLFGGVLGLAMGWVALGLDVALEMALLFARQHATLGFIGGSAFATLLRAVEGRRRFDELSIPRFAVWGAVGGLLIGGGWEMLMSLQYGVGFGWTSVQMLAISGLLGSVSAAGSLAVAIGVEDRELLEEGDRAAEIGLSEEEKRSLLGSLSGRFVIQRGSLVLPTESCPPRLQHSATARPQGATR